MNSSNILKMPVDFQAVMDALAQAFEDRNLKCAVTESLHGGLVTGASAILGGLLLGPIGLAVGGAVGGGASALAARNKFKPVAVVLREMSYSQKKLLHSKIQNAFRNVGVEDLTTIAMLIMTTTRFQDLAIKVASDFVTKELSLRITN